MSTSKGFIEFLTDSLMHIYGIRFKYMFGEYAIYKDGVVIGLICDDTFFIKITTGSKNILGEGYKTGLPYPKAKPQFKLDEGIIEDKELIKNLIESVKKDLENNKK